MAKQRYIDTRFWHDTFVRESLNPLDRYLFLYFLTNDKTNIAGFYELPISIIASETGLEKEMIVKMLKRLKGKVEYAEGWIYIPNFQKYQNTNNPKIQKGIEVELSQIPIKIKDKIGYGYPIYKLSHSNTNSNTNYSVGETFNKFWESYPKKVSKKKAEQIWQKIPPSEHDSIFKALSVARASSGWTKDGGQFIPFPTTWLNQERWKDEILTTSAPAKKSCKSCSKDSSNWIQVKGGFVCSAECMAKI